MRATRSGRQGNAFGAGAPHPASERGAQFPPLPEADFGTLPTKRQAPGRLSFRSDRGLLASCRSGHALSGTAPPMAPEPAPRDRGAPMRLFVRIIARDLRPAREDQAIQDAFRFSKKAAIPSALSRLSHRATSASMLRAISASPAPPPRSATSALPAATAPGAAER